MPSSVDGGSGSGDASVATLGVVVILELFLVLLQLVGKLGDHRVDGFMQGIGLLFIFEAGHAVGVETDARTMERAAGLVLVLVDGKDHVEGGDVVEKAFEAADLLFHALAQGRVGWMCWPLIWICMTPPSC